MKCQLTSIENSCKDKFGKDCEIYIDGKAYIVHSEIDRYQHNLKWRESFGSQTDKAISEEIASKRHTNSSLFKALVPFLSDIKTETELIDFLSNKADQVIVDFINNPKPAAAKPAAAKPATSAADARDTQNAHLKANGYKWGKQTRYGNQYDECGSEVWVLRSSDGRIVSVAQALEEIERGAAVVLAEKESAIAKEKAEAKAKELAEQAAIAKEQAVWQAAEETHIADMESTQVSDWSEVAIAEVVYSDKRHTIKNATFRNAPAKVVITKMIDDHHTLYVPSSKKCYPPAPVGSADYHQQRASKLFL